MAAAGGTWRGEPLRGGKPRVKIGAMEGRGLKLGEQAAEGPSEESGAGQGVRRAPEDDGQAARAGTARRRGGEGPGGPGGEPAASGRRPAAGSFKKRPAAPARRPPLGRVRPGGAGAGAPRPAEREPELRGDGARGRGAGGASRGRPRAPRLASDSARVRRRTAGGGGKEQQQRRQEEEEEEAGEASGAELLQRRLLCCGPGAPEVRARPGPGGAMGESGPGPGYRERRGEVGMLAGPVGWMRDGERDACRDACGAARGCSAGRMEDLAPGPVVACGDGRKDAAARLRGEGPRGAGWTVGVGWGTGLKDSQPASRASSSSSPTHPRQTGGRPAGRVGAPSERTGKACCGSFISSPVPLLCTAPAGCTRRSWRLLPPRRPQR